MTGFHPPFDTFLATIIPRFEIKVHRKLLEGLIFIQIKKKQDKTVFPEFLYVDTYYSNTYLYVPPV